MAVRNSGCNLQNMSIFCNRCNWVNHWIASNVNSNKILHFSLIIFTCALKQVCPWDEHIFIFATKGKHDQILQCQWENWMSSLPPWSTVAVPSENPVVCAFMCSSFHTWFNHQFHWHQQCPVPCARCCQHLHWINRWHCQFPFWTHCWRVLSSWAATSLHWKLWIEIWWLQKVAQTLWDKWKIGSQSLPSFAA